MERIKDRGMPPGVPTLLQSHRTAAHARCGWQWD